MLKNIIKLGAVALFLLAITLCITYSIKDNYPAFKVRHKDELKDAEGNGVEPASYIADVNDFFASY